MQMAIIQQDAFTLLLRFLQDLDLLLDVFNSSSELSVEAVCQARHHRKPWILLQSGEGLMDRWVAGKRFHRTTAQVQ